MIFAAEIMPYVDFDLMEVQSVMDKLWVTIEADIKVLRSLIRSW